MRTTLVLDDQIFRRAKTQAAASRITLSEMVNTALRKHLLGRKEIQVASFSMPVFGEATSLHQSPEDLSKLRDEGR